MPALFALLLILPSPVVTEETAGFDPIRFFEGRTRGHGSLKIILRARQTVAVEGVGRVDPDGTLVLTQTVTQGGQPARTRAWRLRQVSPGHYAGTLTDAVGPVTATSAGRVLTLRFPSKGVAVEQVLTLSDDGRSARNILTARKLGIRVARLDETIVKLD